MRTSTNKVMQLGDLIVAIFDAAADSSTDPKEVSRLAKRTAMHMIKSVRKDINPITAIDCIEHGMSSRETSLGRSMVKPSCGPS